MQILVHHGNLPPSLAQSPRDCGHDASLFVASWHNQQHVSGRQRVGDPLPMSLVGEEGGRDQDEVVQVDTPPAKSSRGLGVAERVRSQRLVASMTFFELPRARWT
jgi:hypothetical protein